MIIRLKPQDVVVGKAVVLNFPAYEFDIIVGKNSTIKGYLYLTKNQIHDYHKGHAYAFVVKSAFKDYVVLSAELSSSQKDEIMRKWKHEQRSIELYQNLLKQFRLKIKELNEILGFHRSIELYEVFEQIVLGERQLQLPPTTPDREQTETHMLQIIEHRIHPRLHTASRTYELVIYESNGIKILNELWDMVINLKSYQLQIIYLGAQKYELRMQSAEGDHKTIRREFNELSQTIKKFLEPHRHHLEEQR